jgi:hypothetical protein
MAPLFSALRSRGSCVSKEPVESAAGRVEKALLLLRAVMHQRAAVSIHRILQKPVHRQLSQRRIFVEVTDDLPAQHPEVVDVFLNGFCRQI